LRKLEKSVVFVFRERQRAMTAFIIMGYTGLTNSECEPDSSIPISRQKDHELYEKSECFMGRRGNICWMS
jgi:hypothetical protein